MSIWIFFFANSVAPFHAHLTANSFESKVEFVSSPELKLWFFASNKLIRFKIISFWVRGSSTLILTCFCVWVGLICLTASIIDSSSIEDFRRISVRDFLIGDWARLSSEESFDSWTVFFKKKFVFKKRNLIWFNLQFHWQQFYCNYLWLVMNRLIAHFLTGYAPFCNYL